jgi:peptide/nickel transport system permease protein
VGTYIVRRLIWAVFLVLVVMVITFLLFNYFPTADIAQIKAGRNATPETVAVIRQQLGLDDPLWKQFGSYVGDLFLHFDFGRSYGQNADVKTLIFQALPNTLVLIAGAAIVWLAVGITVGIISATRRGTFLDRAAMTSSLVLISAPVYFLGLVALYLFSSDLGVIKIFPPRGSYDVSNGLFTNIGGMVLPWLVLASAFSAIYARLLRSNLLEVMSEDYIRTARAKGLSGRRVIFRHGVRSAITPIVTVFGLDVGILVGGAILTETVFNIPGIGRLSLDAIERNDVPIVQGTTLFLALAIMLSSLVVDVLYAFLDPRVRYS